MNYLCMEMLLIDSQNTACALKILRPKGAFFIPQLGYVPFLVPVTSII